MAHKHVVLISGLAAISLFACLPDPEFSEVPTLAFESLVTQPDGRATLTLRFTDGDGNVGLSRGHPSSVLSDVRSPPQFGRRIPRVERQCVANTPLLVPYAYRVPVAEPTGSSPALDGTIALELTSWYLTGTDADSVRFVWTLWDRDLNASDKAVTDAFPVP